MTFVSVDKLKVREESFKGRKNTFILEKLLEDPDEVVSAIVVGNNLANITASILAGALATALVGNIGVGIATAAMTLLIVIFGEAIPITPKRAKIVFMTVIATKITRYV